MTSSKNAKFALESITIDAANIKSRIIRYVVPLLGGPEAKKRDQEPGLRFLESISTQQIIDLKPELLEQWLKELQADKKISNGAARNVKSAFMKFRSHILKNNWAEDTKEEVNAVNFRRLHKKERLRSSYRPPYGLGKCVGDFFNPKLEQQIKDFEEFLRGFKGEKSTNIFVGDVLAILGWLTTYQVTPPLAANMKFKRERKALKEVRSGKFPMQELCFEHIIPFVELSLPQENYACRKDRQEAEEDAYERATLVAKNQMNKIIMDFLNFYSPIPKTRETLLNVFLAVAKYIYRNQRVSDRRFGYDENYERIPAIIEIRRLLKEVRKKIKHQQPAVSKERKSLEWFSETEKDIYDVLFHLKSLADAETKNNRTLEKRGKIINIPGGKRQTKSIAQDYIRFLIIAFLCVIPPARQQFLRDLILEESFVWGEIKNNQVISVEKMIEPTKARWIFGLKNGKTFETYGFQPYYLPNYEFPDGTYLYDYVNRWVYEYREALDPKVRHLFFGVITKRELNEGSVYSCIRNAVEGYTGAAISPHDFRRMFNSYIENEHVNPQLKSNMRVRQMTQSDKIAREVYAKPNPDKIDAPMNKFFQDLLNKKSLGKSIAPAPAAKETDDAKAKILALIDQLSPEEREQIKLDL